METVMINAQEAKTTEEVMQLLQEERFNTVVTYCDHYPGNSKGDFYTVGEFARRVKEYGVNWYTMMDDRGILEIFFVENKIEEINNIVIARRELIRKIEFTRYFEKDKTIDEREEIVKEIKKEMESLYKSNLENFYISSKLYSYEISR